MKMFSNCSGECCVCANGGACLTRHSDDDFSPASKEQIIENLDKGRYPYYTGYMIQYLASEFDYVYDNCGGGNGSDL